MNQQKVVISRREANLLKEIMKEQFKEEDYFIQEPCNALIKTVSKSNI